MTLAGSAGRSRIVLRAKYAVLAALLALVSGFAAGPVPCLGLWAGEAAPPAASDPKAGEEAKTGDDGKNAAAAKAEEDEAKKAEDAKKREEVLTKAQHEADVTDQELLSVVPSTFNFLVDVKILGRPIWRFAVAILAVLAIVTATIYVHLRLGARLARLASGERRQGLQMAFDVFWVTLRRPALVFALGLTLSVLSWLFVTSYHPEAIWVSSFLNYLAVVVFFFDLVGLVDRYYGDRIFRSPDPLLDTVRPILVKLVRAFILLVALLHVYQSLTGQTLFSIVAGLGIGGLALALASQETLKNLLGFASIAFDQPFLVGDTIVVNGTEGVVESVGMRTLRIRKWDGACSIVPNSSAINSEVQNKSRRPYIRRTIRLALSPMNTHERVALAMDLVAEVLKNHQGPVAGKPPKVFFDDYEPGRFILVAYFWYDSGLDGFYDESSRINLEICRRLSESGVKFSLR